MSNKEHNSNTREKFVKWRIMGNERVGIYRHRYKWQDEILSRCKGRKMEDGEEQKTEDKIGKSRRQVWGENRDGMALAKLLTFSFLLISQDLSRPKLWRP